MAKTKSLTEAVALEVKSKFDLSKFKEKKLLNTVVKFKEQRWLYLSEAYQEITSTPGLPIGHIVLLRGHSDTGKTTALLEAAVSAQKQGYLPVFIITEMKWSWEHAKKMGFQFTEVVDKDTGEIINYDGDFIFVDRSNLESIEDVAGFINDLLAEQKKGNLPRDLVFMWDSIGSVPCELSIKSGRSSNEWNAGAMSTQFGNGVNQFIPLSRKENYPYTNTLICINKVWAARAESPMSQPKMMNKGGMSMWFDATFVVTFGNPTNAGTNKIKATKGGKEVEFAKRTNIQIEKNHINGIQTRGKVIMTPEGFIKDTTSSIEKYKKAHSHEWINILGEGETETVEEAPDTVDYFDNE